MIVDSYGVLGMPMKLTMAMVIIATTTPLVMGMVDDADDRMDIIDSNSDVRALEDGIKRTLTGGIGTVNVVIVELESTKQIEIGGDGYIGLWMRVLKNGEKIDRIQLDHPILGDVTYIGDGDRVEIECVNVNGTYGVEVRVC